MAHRGHIRRRWACGTLAAALGLSVLATVSEFIAFEWWSSVNVPRLRQRFVVVVRSQLHIGTRGTAGFFNRGIPMAGARFTEPRWFGPEPWYNRLVARWYSINQTHGVAVPLLVPAAAFGGLGVWGLWGGRKAANDRCIECGYDLSGLKGEVCPECGTLRAL